VHHSPPSLSSELCFVAAPRSAAARHDELRLLFHFEGATLDLPRGNYMFEMEEAAGRSVITCLAISNAGPGSV
jgi:hypothetical protein